MEQENRLEQNRYSITFVGLSTAQEADSFTANTCGRQKGGQSDGNFDEEERKRTFIKK